MSFDTGQAMFTQRAGDVLPGDCCRINGCWETVYMVGGGVAGEQVQIHTEAGRHDFEPGAMVETAEAN